MRRTTLHREGWIDERPFAVIRDEDDGAIAFHCLKCDTETVPDARAFADHFCHKAEPTKAAEEVTNDA